MEAEAPPSAENDAFPKQDFTEISDSTEGPLSKPTFKSTLQAKKRLQAFSSNRVGALSTSPVAKKAKTEAELESPKKTVKKGHVERAKAVIEEIEAIKRCEQAYIEHGRNEQKRSKSRSRSRSSHRERFKKIRRKPRNYRRRSSTPERSRRKSSTPERPKKVEKKPQKYPKTWKEFKESNCGFDLNRDPKYEQDNTDASKVTHNHDLVRHLRFESPSLPISPIKMKTATNKEDKAVPFEYLRYTRVKPSIHYSINFTVIKQAGMLKRFLLDTLPKEYGANLEKLYADSLKYKMERKLKTRPWFLKLWKEPDVECQVLENSTGLSILKSYSGEEEELPHDEEPGEILSDEHEQEPPSKKIDPKPDAKKPKEKKKKLKKNVEKRKKKKKKGEKEVAKEEEPAKKKNKSKKVTPKKKEKLEKRVKDKKAKKQVVKSKAENVEEKSAVKQEKIVEEKVEQKKEEKAKKAKRLSRKRKTSVTEVGGKKHKREKFRNQEGDEKSKKDKEKHPKTPKKNEDEEGWKEIKTKTGEEGFKEEALSRMQTPDTDEYHSHWESDDDVATVARQQRKLNRSWESDEELFERPYHRNKPEELQSYANLEIPLNIKFPRRSRWEERPFSNTENELKQLEEQRRSLDQERRKLEVEKQKILKLQEEARLIYNEKRASTPEIIVKKEKSDISDFAVDLNNSLLSNVSSLESNFPGTVLENEYEEFIKAVNSDTSQSQTTPKKKEKKVRSESTDSSSSSSRDRKKKRKKKKRRKKYDGLLPGKDSNIFNEFDIPVPGDLPEMVPTPVPVPSPTFVPVSKPKLLLPVPELAMNQPGEKIEGLLDLSKPFAFPSITLHKKQLLDNSSLKLDDETDETVELLNVIAKIEEQSKEAVKHAEKEKEEEEKKKEIENKALEKKDGKKKAAKEIDVKEKKKEQAKKVEKKTTPEKVKPRGHERDTRYKRSDPTPPRRRHGSPRRTRWQSPSPRRRLSPRRRYHSPSLSPPRSRLRNRSLSPRRRASPLNSPLDGFRKSVADSTISDDMLPQPPLEEESDSPLYKKSKRSISPNSPKRIPLEDRINQVLGLERDKKEPPPKPITVENTTYQSYDYYNRQCTQYNRLGPFTQPPPPIAKPPPPPPSKIVQVGNILQVVPIEDIPPPPPPKVEVRPQEMKQQILQVGNMLQIVPGTSVMVPPPVPSPAKPIVQVTLPEVVVAPPPPVEKPSAEAVMRQRIAERRVEREERRQERERRRKEKEKKRKDREKRRQIKSKLKTENMIKRALQLETEALAADEGEKAPESPETPVQWPPTPVTLSSSPSGKGILLVSGSKKRKSVQFADGVRPGEGTSPSGGEELSSPPPPPKSFKEKRYKRIKVPKKAKKQKIRVKVVKKVPMVEEDDDDDEDEEEDNLPPPSPPPGSPPPHVFPSRVKTHTINNVHQFVAGLVPTSTPPPNYAFRPPMAMVMNRPPHQPPPGFLPNPFHENIPPPHPPPTVPYQGVMSHN